MVKVQRATFAAVSTQRQPALASSAFSLPLLSCATQGCFWGVEQKFLQKFKGAVQTTVGYTGGKTQEPTYMQVRQFTGVQ